MPRESSLDDSSSDKRDGTRRDAILHSVGANSAHGQRRSNQDKRKAVMTLLEDDEWSKNSSNWVAGTAKVSWDLVNDMRKELSLHVPEVRNVRTKHGTTATMNTANIGKRKPDEAPPEAEDSPPDGGDREQAPDTVLSNHPIIVCRG